MEETTSLAQQRDREIEHGWTVFEVISGEVAGHWDSADTGYPAGFYMLDGGPVAGPWTFFKSREAAQALADELNQIPDIPEDDGQRARFNFYGEAVVGYFATL